MKKEFYLIYKEEKAITLISLIITITILIILSVITVNGLFGDNGLITMAQKAKNMYEESVKKEEQELDRLLEKNYANYNGQLYVEDGKLLNQYNEQVQLNGLFYGGGNADYTKEALTALKAWGVNMIKIGYSYSGGATPYNEEGNMEKMFSFIDQLIKMDFYIDIIYWSDTDLYQEEYDKASEAIEYFTQIANKYPDNKHILYEICNEPFDNTWEEVKSYADTVIPKIRKISPNSIISVPTNDNNFNTKFINNLLNYNNILYVTHIYSDTKNGFDNIHLAIEKKLPIFISEWSNINVSGTNYDNEFTNYLIYLIKNNKISNSAWYFYGSSYRDSDFFMIKKEYWDEFLKTGKLSDDMLGISGIYYKEYITGKNNGEIRQFLKAYNYTYSNQGIDIYFWDEKYRNNITKIIFETKIDMPDNVIEYWDVSDGEPNSVIAYIVDDGNNKGFYELYICDNNKKVKVSSLERLFANFANLEYIDITQLDGSVAKNMERIIFNR